MVCAGGVPEVHRDRGIPQGTRNVGWSGGHSLRDAGIAPIPSEVSSQALQKLGWCWPGRTFILKETVISHVAHDTEGLVTWSSHPTPILGTGQHLSPPKRTAREPVLPPLPLTFSAAHGKFTHLGARAWREVARESPLLPPAKSDVPWVLGSGFSQDPCLLATWGILMKNLHPVCVPLHQNTAPVWLISILWLIWKLLKQTPGDPLQ